MHEKDMVLLSLCVWDGPKSIVRASNFDALSLKGKE